ncbi:MAG: hypothetical protein WC648_00405 [Candidatus Paceibacterota bacterium]|jgi:hypothetical protein
MKNRRVTWYHFWVLLTVGFLLIIASRPSTPIMTPEPTPASLSPEVGEVKMVEEVTVPQEGIVPTSTTETQIVSVIYHAEPQIR